MNTSKIKKERPSSLHFYRLFVCLLLLLSCLPALSAQNNTENNARAILQKAYERVRPDDQKSTSQLVLLDKSGNKRSRSILQYSRETAKGTDSFVEFSAPADVRGTKFLTIGHGKEGQDDEQRLFLPALGSPRRIASSDKGSSFMGTELFFYDLESKEIDEFTNFEYIKRETFRKVDCDVLSTVAKDSSAPYSKQMIWVGKDDSVIYKVEAYDKSRSKSLLKKIITVSVARVGKYIIADKLYVENVQNGNKTLLSLKDIQVDQGLPDKIFSVQNLQK